MAPIETYLTLALAAGVLAPCAAFITAPVATPITWMRPSGTQLSPIVAGGPAGRATAASPAALQGRAWRTTLEAGVRQVTAEQLEKEMTEWELPMILDVFATWCGPCLILKPELDKVAQALDGKCRVLKLDSDEHSDMASALHVFGLPTVMYMKDGELRHKTEGSVPAEEILQLADFHFFGGEPPEDPAKSLFIDTNSCCSDEDIDTREHSTVEKARGSAPASGK